MTIKETAIDLYKAEHGKCEIKTFNHITEAKIEVFEKRYQVELTQDFKDWLYITNGSNVGPGGLFGIETGRNTNDIQFYLTIYPGWSDLKYIPVASDGCGNTYLLDLTNSITYGFVFFIDSYEEINKPTYYAASNFWCFLYFLLTREATKGHNRWPFNKRLVLSKDPDIVKAPKKLLPWNLPD